MKELKGRGLIRFLENILAEDHNPRAISRISGVYVSYMACGGHEWVSNMVIQRELLVIFTKLHVVVSTLYLVTVTLR